MKSNISSTLKQSTATIPPDKQFRLEPTEYKGFYKELQTKSSCEDKSKHIIIGGQMS